MIEFSRRQFVKQIGIVAVIFVTTVGLSPKTPSSKLLNNWLESMSFPRFLKPFANNGVIRPIFF